MFQNIIHTKDKEFLRCHLMIIKQTPGIKVGKIREIEINGETYHSVVISFGDKLGYPYDRCLECNYDTGGCVIDFAIKEKEEEENE